MPNISLAMFQSSAGSSGSGDVAWTDHAKALVRSDDSPATYATVTLSDGQESQGLDLTNPAWDHAPESGADSYDGLLVEVHCYTWTGAAAVDDLTFAEAAALNSGSTIGTDQAAGQAVGHGTGDSRSNITVFGAPDDDLDITLSSTVLASSTFGVRLRVANATGASRDGRVVYTGVAAYWTASPRCRLVPMTALAREVGQILMVHARDSIVGDSYPEDVCIRYTWTAPGGHTWRTFTEPNFGDTISQEDGGRGWVCGIQAQAEGSYTVTAECFCKYAGAWVRATSNTVTFTVGASTRTLVYLDPSGGDDGNGGTSAVDAWATLDAVYTATNGKGKWELVIADDTELDVATLRAWTDLSNVLIRRSGDGTAKPIIKRTTSGQIWQWGNATDLVFQGLDIRGEVGTPNQEPNAFHALDQVHGLGLIDCDCTNVQSVVEGNGISCVLCDQCTIGHLRYCFGTFRFTSDPSVGGMCVWGGDWSVYAAESGEGSLRLEAALASVQYGELFSAVGVDFDNSAGDANHSVFRHAWHFTGIYSCKITGGTIGASAPPDGSASNGPGDWVCQVVGCVINTDAIGFLSRQGHHFLLAHCVVEGWIEELATMSGSAGRIHRYSLANNQFRVPSGVTDAIFGTQSGLSVSIYGLMAVGNVIVYEDAIASATAVKFINDTTSAGWFTDNGAFEYNIVAKDRSQTFANTNYANTAAVNALGFATGNAVVATEGSDCDADNGWTASGWDILPALSVRYPEDMRRTLIDPDVTANAGPRSSAADDATAYANYDDVTPGDPSYAGTWALVARDPGVDAEDYSGGGGGGAMGSQTLASSTTSTDWAECRGDGSAGTTGANPTRCTGHTSATNARTAAFIFVATDDIPDGSTIDTATLSIDPENTSSDDLSATFFMVDEADCDTFNTTTRDPEALARLGSGVHYAQDAVASGGGYATFDIAAIFQEYLDAHGVVTDQRIGMVLRGDQALGGSKVFSVGLPTAGNPIKIDVTWTAPSPPELSSPADDEVVATPSPTFAWTSGTAPFVLKIVNLATEGSFDDPAYSYSGLDYGDAAGYTIADTLTNGSYRWRIEDDNGQVSEENAFDIDSTISRSGNVGISFSIGIGF